MGNERDALAKGSVSKKRLFRGVQGKKATAGGGITKL
jgi:hypothetical protein